jgi:hypothetical protein
MSRESPSDYMRRYHNLMVSAVSPHGLPMTDTVHVTRYKYNGSTERSRLLHALKKVGIKVPVDLYSAYDWFTFPVGDPIGTQEPFFWQSIRRSFGFKATPDEMRDTLRLACRLGRVGIGKDVAGQRTAAPTMAAYAKEFFSLDCNGFVGNYWGVSPEVHQSSWAVISAREEAHIQKKAAIDDGWNGWVRAAVLTLDYIPLTPRKSAKEARTGDVLITRKTTGVWSHIAVVDEVSWLGANQVKWRVVEYGESTSEESFETEKDNHIKPVSSPHLIHGEIKSLGLGYWNEGRSKFRYLFAGPNTPFEPAEFGRCGQEVI